MHFLYALITGGLAGLHNSTWGMYKDAPHEGFTWPKYFRSTIAGLIYGPIIWYLFDMDLSMASQVAVLFGATYLAERATMEVYKTFFREEDQSKYFIPMQLSVLGKPVKSRAARWVSAVIYVGVLVFIGYLIYKLNQSYQAGNITMSPWLILLICSVGGWISAFGGAWKDAPLEGFETFKFFRSPGVAYFWAFMASLLTNNLMLITMCSIGFTIASIETYKSFFFLHKPRGKFAGMPILFPEMLEKRKPFRYLFAGIWVYVLVHMAIGIINTTDPLSLFG